MYDDITRQTEKCLEEGSIVSVYCSVTYVFTLELF